jgi:hypothetical protein
MCTHGSKKEGNPIISGNIDERRGHFTYIISQVIKGYVIQKITP